MKVDTATNTISAARTMGSPVSRPWPFVPLGILNSIAIILSEEIPRCHSLGALVYTPSRPDACGREGACSPANSPAHRPLPIPLFIDKRLVLLNSIQNALQLHPVPSCIGFCLTLPIQDWDRMRFLFP